LLLAAPPAYGAGNGGRVIISCPNCGANYQVAVGVVMRRPRMKCADCSHRWVPAEEIDEDEAIAAVQEEVRAARNPPPPAPEPEPEPIAPEPEPPENPGEPSPPLLKWLVAIALGAAFATASLGLWVGRVDPERLIEQVPLLADALAGLSPPSPRLDVGVQGRVTRLPGGNALLEVTGTITNPGTTAIPMPPLAARLLVNGVPTRDWTIPPPAPSVAPGKRLAFASSLTDVPDGPVTVQVRFSR
jgi:hypothetical protein